MTDILSILEQRGGVRHYPEEPDYADRTRRAVRRRWPWPDMRPNDFVFLETTDLSATQREAVEATFMVAKAAACQYGRRTDRRYRSWTHAAGCVVYREK